MRKLLAAALAAAAMLPGVPAAQAAQPPIRGAITSFDGTQIVYNLFLPDGASSSNPAPVVMQTHGWGGSGAASLGGQNAEFVADGWALLTWDSRGFGASGGETYVDDPGHEARDASYLIDMLARRNDIAKESANDPLIGMTGGSYAGGIQLALASHDSRVDAIVPNITWNDLRYSLFPGGVIKLGFDTLLYGAGLATAASGGLNPTNTAGVQTGAYDTGIHRAEVTGAALGYADQQTMDWFAGRSVAGYGFGHPVNVPTLITQGVSDALFNVNEGIANVRHVAATGAPASLIAFCGGHVGCPGNYDNTNENFSVGRWTKAWLDHYVRGLDTDLPSTVEAIYNDGSVRSFDTIDAFADGNSSVNVPVSGSVVNTGAKTSLAGPEYAPAATNATPSSPNDPGTLTIDTGITGGSVINGVGRANLSVAGTGGTHLFLKLVDREANQVIDLEEAAIRIEDLSAPQNIELDLVSVQYVVPEGHHVDLQISTSSGAMAEFRGAGLVNLSGSVSIPTL